MQVRSETKGYVRVCSETMGYMKVHSYNKRYVNGRDTLWLTLKTKDTPKFNLKPKIRSA
jgi:hypothetical protein